MSKDKDSFVFYRDWYNALTACDDATQLKLYRAIMEYVFLDLQPTEPSIQLAFSIIRQRLDADREKWEGIKKKRRQAGRRGNEKRWGTKGEQKIASVANATKCEQMVASVAVNGNVNVSNDTNVSMLDEKKLSKESKKNATDVAAHAQELLEVRKKKFYDSLIPYVQMYGKQMIREFYDYWTEDNKSKTRFRQEMEKTWSLERRLRTWADRDYNRTNGTDRSNTTEEERRDAVANYVAELFAQDDAKTGSITA